MFTEIYDSCFSCKRKKLFVRKRKIKLPIGEVANSREKFCNKCFKQLQAEIESKHD